jgi:hypothetical protein
VSAPAARIDAAAQDGQATVLLVGILCAVLFGAMVLALMAGGVGARGRQQRAADLGALAAARVMHDLHPRLFEPPFLADGAPNPRHLERAAYLAQARERGQAVAHANGAEAVDVAFPQADPIAPTRVRVDVGARLSVTVAGRRGDVDVAASADAEIVPVAAAPFAPTGDEYRGPLAYRQGKPMRPDVAVAFDRMAAAAAADGITLIVSSAYRTNAEQAVLFAQHPDPRWVAPAGVSLHRFGTELDLGPIAAYPWLAANAPRFHFTQRYSWEPWHYGTLLAHKGRGCPNSHRPPSRSSSRPTFRLNLPTSSRRAPTATTGPSAPSSVAPCASISTPRAHEHDHRPPASNLLGGLQHMRLLRQAAVASPRARPLPRAVRRRRRAGVADLH